eukprot:scaffold22680_cov39-Phaeocystis_antarctica.AAC.2
MSCRSRSQSASSMFSSSASSWFACVSSSSPATLACACAGSRVRVAAMRLHLLSHCMLCASEARLVLR